MTEFMQEQMVNQQVRAGDVLDQAVLATMRRIPRERFVPKSWRELAFADTAVALPAGQRMLAPVLIGQFLQALELTRADRVLEIGTGSGYLSACMAQHAASVQSLELHAELAEFARANLAAAEIGGVEVQTANAYEFAGKTGYNAIVLTGSLPVADDRFAHWLADGGRLLAVVGLGGNMDAQLTRRVGGDQFVTTSLFETSIPPLEHSRQAAAFTF